MPPIDPNIQHDGRWHQDPNDPMHSYTYIREFIPPGVVRRIGGGSSFHVGILDDGGALKYPLVEGEGRSLAIEAQIFAAIGTHERIINCLGLTPHGLKLELATEGSISCYLEKMPASMIPTKLRLKWSRQAAEAVAFIHSKGVIHCDIHTNNLLLDNKLDLKLCDFQGTFQELDGHAMEGARSFLPREATTPPSVTTDLFALGSAIYTIMTGFEPFSDLSDHEVEECYTKHQFPAIDAVVGGEMIRKCWMEAYQSAKELIDDLAAMESTPNY